MRVCMLMLSSFWIWLLKNEESGCHVSIWSPLSSHAQLQASASSMHSCSSKGYAYSPHAPTPIYRWCSHPYPTFLSFIHVCSNNINIRTYTSVYLLAMQIRLYNIYVLLHNYLNEQGSRKHFWSGPVDGHGLSPTPPYHISCTFHQCRS